MSSSFVSQPVGDDTLLVIGGRAKKDCLSTPPGLSDRSGCETDGRGGEEGGRKSVGREAESTDAAEECDTWRALRILLPPPSNDDGNPEPGGANEGVGGRLLPLVNPPPEEETPLSDRSPSSLPTSDARLGGLDPPAPPKLRSAEMRFDRLREGAAGFENLSQDDGAFTSSLTSSGVARTDGGSDGGVKLGGRGSEEEEEEVVFGLRGIPEG